MYYHCDAHSNCEYKAIGILPQSVPGSGDQQFEISSRKKDTTNQSALTNANCSFFFGSPKPKRNTSSDSAVTAKPSVRRKVALPLSFAYPKDNNDSRSYSAVSTVIAKPCTGSTIPQPLDVERPTTSNNVSESKANTSGLWGKAHVTNDTQSIYVKPFVPRAGAQIYAVSAGMGMGKTTQLKKFIDDHPESSFLVISSRISLSHTLLGILPDFQHYTSRDWNGKRLVVQYESLHHIIKCYDYVVLDEIRSIISCLTSIKTNRLNLRTNALILRTLIAESKLTLALDADMEVDDAVPFFLTTIARSESIQLVRYTKKRLRRSLHISKDEKFFVAKV